MAKIQMHDLRETLRPPDARRRPAELKNMRISATPEGATISLVGEGMVQSYIYLDRKEVQLLMEWALQRSIDQLGR